MAWFPATAGKGQPTQEQLQEVCGDMPEDEATLHVGCWTSHFSTGTFMSTP